MSEDGTGAVLRDFIRDNPAGRSIRIIPNAARIVSSGLNAAIGAARGEVIVRMDCHTEYARDYLVQCVACLNTTKADNVGGPARTRPESYMERCIAAAYHSPFAVGGARFHDVDFEGYVDTVTYGCWRKSSFTRFGLFDEGLVRNQDDEHNLRIIRGGGRIWQSPRIRSWYRPRASLDAVFRQYMQYGYWKVRVIQKHCIPASWRHLIPGMFVASLLGFTLLWLIFALISYLLPSFAGNPTMAGFARTASDLSFSLLVLGVVVYGAAVGVASILTASRKGWDLLPVLPWVFPCYQVGYGWGFLRGLWDFGIRRRGPREAFGRLTRGELKVTSTEILAPLSFTSGDEEANR
jgi:hypothetical protein